MANEKTILDEWAVKDLEDGSSLKITVMSCTELGNQSLPGLQVYYMGHIVNYEPLAVERLAYQASKAGVTDYLLEDQSWMYYDDQFVKNYLVIDSPLKIKVEVKTRSSKVVSKTYELPFEV
ncbi:hypothetical protein IC229_16125 [Spirosoma sp. BT702]|uniref:Uncharacterized protein n=1 Tax=Spirosoma profusum TaxID=2771354 RepID=A0A927AT02_9BACT|nr:hypothetical protein [Spirosoma profusum]MBD2702180.1 hypothetical protein [Spirosoma profusum]